MYSPFWKSDIKYKVFIVDTIEQQLLDDMAKESWDLNWCFVKWDKIYLVFKKWMNG